MGCCGPGEPATCEGVGSMRELCVGWKVKGRGVPHCGCAILRTCNQPA